MNSCENVVVIPPELWGLVFGWVDVTEGLANVGLVNRSFYHLVRLQFQHRHKEFETRLAEGKVEWKRVACVDSAAPGLHLQESREGDEAEERRNYLAHSLTYINRPGDVTGPVLVRYGGSFPVGEGTNYAALPFSPHPMLFSPALFFYQFGTATWQRVDQAGPDGWAPEERSGHSAHRINNGAHLLFFGGQSRNREGARTATHPAGWKFLNDAFLFDLSALAWVPLTCKGTPPHPRVAHRSVIVGRKMWVFGGCFMDEDFCWHHFADVWTLDLDMWEWKEEQITGEQPRGRHSHSLCPIPNTKRAILFGGHADTLPQDLNDCFILDTENKTWTKVEYANEPECSPPGRWGHSAFVIGNTLAVLGGLSLEPMDPKFALTKYLWVMDIDGRRWKRHTVALHPSVLPDLSDEERAAVLGREVVFQGAAASVDKIYLFGGSTDHGLWVLE